MTGEPTLHYSDRSADGWVEYAQELLSGVAPHLASDGVFGDQTIQAVYAFQQQNGLMVDGVIGNQTWSVLRVGERAEVGTDGHLHQETDQSMHVVFFTEQSPQGSTGDYWDGGDELMFIVEVVGAVPIPDNTYAVDVTITAPNGTVTPKQALLASGSDTGKSSPGDMMFGNVEGLKAEFGTGDFSFVADIPGELGGERHEGTFTVA
jgi:putative peptidoglycan binding protein